MMSVLRLFPDLAGRGLPLRDGSSEKELDDEFNALIAWFGHKDEKRSE